VTHPFHPLFGREYDLVERRCPGTGGWRYYFHDDDGRLESVPVRWTDQAPADPFVVASAGRAYFRVKELLRLSVLIEGLSEAPAKRGSGPEVRVRCQENYADRVRGILPRYAKASNGRDGESS